MKKYMKGLIIESAIFVILLILLPSAAAAETDSITSVSFPFEDRTDSGNDTQSLFGSKTFKLSGFGGMYMSVAEINGNAAIFSGGRGAFIINDFLLIGGGGCNLDYPQNKSDLSGKSADNDTNSALSMNYGGLLIGCNIFQKSIFNLTVSSIIGGGVLAYSEDDNSDKSPTQWFFAAEPSVIANMNITKWMRIGAGLGYRHTMGIDSNELTDRDFSRPSIIFTMDFGWF